MSEEKNASREIKIPLRVLLWILPIIFGSGAAYLVVKEAPQAQAALELTVTDHNRRLGEHDTKIAVFGTDLAHIKGSVDRIERAITRSSWRDRRRPATP